MNTLADSIDRREFFRQSARYVLLGAMAAAVAVLVRRKQVAGPGSERCTHESRCWDCGVYSKCGLPQAVTRRNAARKG